MIVILLMFLTKLVRDDCQIADGLDEFTNLRDDCQIADGFDEFTYLRDN